MDQPNFPAIGNHLQDFQNGFQGIQNQVGLVANMPDMVDYNELRRGLRRERRSRRQWTNELQQETNQLRQEIAAGIIDIQNGYLY